MAPPPPPTLMDDIIGEILIRLPPGDPACLVRASLVCKLWRGLLSGGGFHRRYRDFHRTPPVLGFFHNRKGTTVPHYVPVAQAPVVPYPAPGSDCMALDCRHGRVLLDDEASARPGLVVWDPITSRRQHVPQPMTNYGVAYGLLTAAVLCASDGCDHHQCCGGPYLIVFVGIDSNSVEHDGYDEEDDFAWASVYSSKTGAWSAEVSVYLGPILFDVEIVGRSLLAGDALYFTLEGGHRILRYDLVGHALSVIDALPVYAGNMALVTAEDGGLGVAGVKGYSLHLWSWKIIGHDNKIGQWVRGKIIDLDMTITITLGDPTTKLDVAGFAECAGYVFITTNDDAIFTVELKSGSVRRIAKRGGFKEFFPFMSFCTPGHASPRLQVPTRTE